MASDKLTMEQRKEYAFMLFTQNHLEQNVIAQKIGVRPNTVSKWVNEGQWKNMRSRMLISREQQVNSLYDQLEKLNTAIRKSKEGHPDTKQADVQIKLTAAIRNMETDLAIADMVQAGIRFVKHLQKTGTIEQVVEVSDLWNSFIMANLK